MADPRYADGHILAWAAPARAAPRWNTVRAISQRDVEVVDGLLALMADMDRQALLAALPELIAQACDPDIEWVEDPVRADGRVHRGHAGVRESWRRWSEGFEQYSLEPGEIVDCGEEVLVVMRERARGAASGADVSSRNCALTRFRDGKLLRYREFYDERAARRAAGPPD
jgi:ketosteroid isomerase-like protein